MPKQYQSLEQKQSLTMTTSMHQSISILQMSNIELAEFASAELSKNPFLEDANVSVEEHADASKLKLNQTYTASGGSGSYSGGYSSQDYLSNIASEKTLKEHLLEQINLIFEDNKEILVAHYLLDHLLSSGYLSIDINEAINHLKCTEELVERVLAKLQTMDPPGIFARNLKECLKIQVRENNIDNPGLIALINNIDLLAKGDVKKLSRICQVNMNHMGGLIKQLKLLNPKPGNGFLDEQTSYKIPDVILSFDNNGDAKLEINTDASPRLRVNEDYYVTIKDNLNNKDERAFTQREIEAASTIVKSIEQRTNTVLKIASAIVEEQLDFFKRGVMYLKPMTLNTIAAKADFNESTVSRSTANKYISTPSGIYELKYFFSSSLASTRAIGSDVSSTKVKELIKQIVMSEEPGETLSDDDIAEQLKSFSVNIARRTVAKYREAIGIPTSSARKRQKAIGEPSFL